MDGKAKGERQRGGLPSSKGIRKGMTVKTW